MIIKKYKLKCFTCADPFESKEEVFRDINNNPICCQCLIEDLEETWHYDFVEHIIEEIKKKFNRNYLRWKKWFYENHIKCDGEEHDCYSFYYEHKDNITVINEKNYCIECSEEMNDI